MIPALNMLPIHSLARKVHDMVDGTQVCCHQSNFMSMLMKQSDENTSDQTAEDLTLPS
jgi:hypothetical protein